MSLKMRFWSRLGGSRRGTSRSLLPQVRWASLAGLALLGGVAAAALLPSPVAAQGGPIPVTPFGNYNPMLTRAPYASDLTDSSVDITWATMPSPAGTPNLRGYLQWGPEGACGRYQTTVPNSLPLSVPAQNTLPTVTSVEFKVNTGTVTRTEYQSTVVLTGLAPGTTYCYRPFGYTYVGIYKTPVDLLGSNPDQTFTTLNPPNNSSTAPLTFDVMGDTGENLANAATPYPNFTNPYQAAIDKLIGQSGARFVVLAGDVGYPSDTNNRYGDLLQGANAANPEVSNFFGPSYWPQTGGIPVYYTAGDHGMVTEDPLRIWPESQTAAASGGVSAPVTYPSMMGSAQATYPTDWYAVQSGNVRLYVLQAAWPYGNAGSAPGGPYQMDYLQRWQQNSAEYAWLKQDLAAHPGGIKMAVFFYPLRSDNSGQPSDTYLQNSSANPNPAQMSLESLLSDNGVYIAFNAHAHTYQRIDPSGPGQLISYVTGGGGGIPSGVTCSANVQGITSLYALGWDPTTLPGVGSSCGVSQGVATSVPVPTSEAQVFNFLKVTVAGNQVTVTPTNAEGQTFDVQTYTFGAQAPQPPGRPVGVSEPSAVSLSWAMPANQDVSATTDYVITPYANGVPQPPVDIHSVYPQYTLTGLTDGTSYTFSVVATNSQGTSPPSAISAPVVPGAPAPATYDPVTPYRVCDTRAGNPSQLSGVNLTQCEGQTLGAGSSLTVQIAGTNPSGATSGGVPPGATSAVLNVTATDTTAPSYLTVWPAGGPPPLSSSLNWQAGQTVANLVTVDLGPTGAVSVYNDQGQADVVIDVEGWMDSTATSGAVYVPVTPYRICDTRAGFRPLNQCTGRTLGPNTTLTVTAAGTAPAPGGPLPPAGAVAVNLTVTATDTTQPSFLSVWPATAPQPIASNLNWQAGQTVANNVVVAVPTSGATLGQLEIYNDAGSADVVVDVSGYYLPASPPPSNAVYFTPMVPYRICDTRSTAISQLQDACTGDTLQGGSPLRLLVAGVGGIPSGATSVVLNVTITDTTAPGFLTVFPDLAPLPLSSNLNWSAGETVAVGVTATLGSDGALDFYIPQGSADLVVDVVGWWE